MTILVLSNGTGGIWTFRRELLFELKKKYRVVIASRFSDFEDKLSNSGFEMHNILMERRGKSPRDEVKLCKDIRKIIVQVKPDIVITYTIKPNIYGGFVCKLLKIPYVVNITGLGTAFQKKGMLRKLVTMMYKVSLKKAKTVFFENSENMQIFLDEKIIRKEQSCLLNGAGVNLEHYSLIEYPQDCDTTRFLFIGRVMKEKGIDELFDAMKQLVSDGISCSLDVLGGYEEDYADTIRKYESEGWLHYHGYQKDVRPFIKRCHCFVLPSWHEGMANTNLECASSGRPVITSNIAGCKEAVIDGESGFLAEKRNVESLYKAMKKFTKLSYEGRKNMGLYGRRHMEEIFDKKKVVDVTINAILK